MFCKRIALISICLLLASAAQAQDKNEEFFAAVRKGDVAAVKTLLDKGTDVNAKTQYGATALSFACDRGYTEVVKLLLDRGADVNATDTFYGETPIGWALWKGHTEVVKLLVARGARGKETALIVGAESGNIEIVKAVLDKGDLKPESLSTALTRAMRGKHTQIIELLKKAGAVPAPQPDFAVDAEILKSYAGTYKSDQGGDLTLIVKDGKLASDGGGGQPFTLGAFNKNTFTALEFDGFTIIFNSENDKVVSLTLKRGERSFEFKKAEQK